MNLAFDYLDSMLDDVERSQRRRSTRCQCFAPGEVGGTCPGPDRCPIVDEHDEDEDDEGDEQ